MASHRIMLSDEELEAIVTALNSAIRPSRKWKETPKHQKLIRLRDRLLDGKVGNPNFGIVRPNKSVTPLASVIEETTNHLIEEGYIE